MKCLNIDIEERRRKRDGFDRVLYSIPGLFNDDLKYKSMAQNTASMIATQSIVHEEIYNYDTSDLYAEDVQLIAKDGKIYYLPEKKAK